MYKTHRVKLSICKVEAIILIVNNRSYALFALIHTNVWGYARYFYIWIVIICIIYRRLIKVYMDLHDEILWWTSIDFWLFHKIIKTKANAKVKILSSDNGGEYMSNRLQLYLTLKPHVHAALKKMGLLHTRTGTNLRSFDNSF